MGFYVRMCVGVSSYVFLYGTLDVTEEHEGEFLDDMFVICGNMRVIFNHPVICVCTNKRDEYGNTRVICDYLNVHVHKNR